jgi:hypothetical protein
MANKPNRLQEEMTELITQTKLTFYKNSVLISTMKLIDYPVVNGVTISQPDKNLLLKLDALGVTVDDSQTYARNPVMGFLVHDLHPVVARLAEWIHQVYATYDMSGTMNYHGKPVTINVFDRVKTLICKLDSRAYMELID